MSQTISRHLCPTGRVSVSARCFHLHLRRPPRASSFPSKCALCSSSSSSKGIRRSGLCSEGQLRVIEDRWCVEYSVICPMCVYARTLLPPLLSRSEAPPPSRLSTAFPCWESSLSRPPETGTRSTATSPTPRWYLPLSCRPSATSCGPLLYRPSLPSSRIPALLPARSGRYFRQLVNPRLCRGQQQSGSGISNHGSPVVEPTASTSERRPDTRSEVQTLPGKPFCDLSKECGDRRLNGRVRWLSSEWRKDAPEVQKLFEQECGPLTCFVEIKSTVLGQMQHLSLPLAIEKDLLAYYSKLFDYTCTGGKLTRGVLVVYAAAAARSSSVVLPNSPSAFLSSPSSSEPTHAGHSFEFTPSFRSLSALGWCLELLQSCFLVVDDVMDASLTRRGKPCWYRCPGVGVSNAVNDSLALEGAVYSVLRAYLRTHPAYTAFQDLLLRNIFTTIIGQHLDTNTFGLPASLSAWESSGVHQTEGAVSSGPSSHPAQPSRPCSLPLAKPSSSTSAWSLSPTTDPSSASTLVQMLEDRQQAIARLKTSHYSFYLPTALGMLYGGCTEPELVAKARDLSLAIGDYFQVQDDFLDCFSNPKTSGKIGSDIQERKCTWLLVQAAKRASREELALLMEKYGKPEEVNWVKALYRRLNLPQVYAEFEEETMSRLTKAVQEVPHDGIQAFFDLVLDRIYKREK